MKLRTELVMLWWSKGLFCSCRDSRFIYFHFVHVTYADGLSWCDMMLVYRLALSMLLLLHGLCMYNEYMEYVKVGDEWKNLKPANAKPSVEVQACTYILCISVLLHEQW